MIVKDVSEKLHVHEETVRRWIRTRRLLATKYGRDFEIAPEDLELFLANNPKYNVVERGPNNKDAARLLRRLGHIDCHLLRLENEIGTLREEYVSLYRELEEILLED